MIGISWGDPIRAAWELGIGISQADPRSPGLPHSRWVGLGIDRTPPGLPHSSFPAPSLRFIAGYLIWRPPTLVASPFKRRVVLGLDRTPPGLRHSSFPACPPIRRCFAGRAAAAAAVVALGVVGSTWYPPPTTFICFSRCARQLVRA
ncbi:hypothetical protein PGT21_010652 [Puccinia graminis f. sp. tritici]|uniref:Uncharacterized protein n=1 Tax=Puccinia graminis f. sp. tritici TaxID=56615 RepID=A0A5B0S676_PUCGR|nr:hypothetical protein PGT21_010652 [Puccinia graminis f. sp. tritici]KAA1133410.1 hypothetical protein PGTUg99_003587 [Puccinia graminis f. sp. tritici]